MSTETTRATMEQYVAALLERGDFGRFFADDVQLTIEGTDVAVSGSEAAEGMIRHLHESAFDAAPEVRALVVDDGRAALEAFFVGRHTGAFAGVAATGRDVRVPYAVVYDLDDDRIRALRIYMATEQLTAQLTAGDAAAAAPGAH